MDVSWRDLVQDGRLALTPGMVFEDGAITPPSFSHVCELTSSETKAHGLNKIDLVDCGATRGAILDQLRERWHEYMSTIYTYKFLDDGGVFEWRLANAPGELYTLADPAELTLLLKAIAVPVPQ
jgi:hypothetical protein